MTAVTGCSPNQQAREYGKGERGQRDPCKTARSSCAIGIREDFTELER